MYVYLPTDAFEWLTISLLRADRGLKKRAETQTCIKSSQNMSLYVLFITHS